MLCKISLLLLLTLPLAAEDMVKSETVSAPGAAPWMMTDYELFIPATFRLHPPVRQVMDRAKMDVGLLNAAIFFATDTEREKHKLPMLRTSRALTACAYEHSRDMALENFFSHDNPNDPAKRTAWQRMEAKGMKSGARAENIAMRTTNGLTRLCGGDGEVVDELTRPPGEHPQPQSPLFGLRCARLHLSEISSLCHAEFRVGGPMKTFGS